MVVVGCRAFGFRDTHLSLAPLWGVEILVMVKRLLSRLLWNPAGENQGSELARLNSTVSEIGLERHPKPLPTLWAGATNMSPKGSLSVTLEILKLWRETLDKGRSDSCYPGQKWAQRPHILNITFNVLRMNLKLYASCTKYPLCVDSCRSWGLGNAAALNIADWTWICCEHSAWPHKQRGASRYQAQKLLARLYELGQAGHRNPSFTFDWYASKLAIVWDFSCCLI